MVKEPSSLPQGIRPFAEDMHSVVGQLAEHSAGVHTARTDLARLSELRALDAVPFVPEHSHVIAAELRSTSAFVSGAAQSVENSIAAASLGLLELADAISAAARSDPHAADLLARIGQLTQHIDAATLKLAQSMHQIEEFILFIDKFALQTGVTALGTGLREARIGEAGHNSGLVASAVHAFAMDTEALGARVHTYSVHIIDSARHAHAAMVHANGVILSFNTAVRAIGGEAAARGLELPGIPHRRATNRSF